MHTLTRIAVFGLGGTIAMTPQNIGGIVPALSAKALMQMVERHETSDMDIVLNDFRSIPSASLTFDDLYELANTITTVCTEGIDGIVVTQGTDTLEETSYLLDLLHQGPQPVVLTGAMRHPDMAGADGPANLLAALRVAACLEAREQGALVVMADEIHAARRVGKTHTTHTGAFQSPDGGPLGYVTSDGPHFWNKLDYRFTVPNEQPLIQPRVGLLTMSFSTGIDLLPPFENLDGLVVAGFGAGHVPADFAPLLGDLASRIPVVLTSRIGRGPTHTSTYGFPGSEIDMISRGLIPSGWLDPYKSRILLHAALAAGADKTTIAAAFGAAGGDAPHDRWPWGSR